MKKIISIILIIISLAVLSACTFGSGIIVNGSEINTPTKMSATYEKFTGFKQTQIKVQDGEEVVVKVNIITDDGKIDAYIAKDNNKTDSSYEGNNIKTSSFTVTLSSPGTYTLRVDAKDHSGGYSFSWGD